MSVGALSSIWMVRVGSMAEDVSATEGAGRPVRVPNASAADKEAAVTHFLALLMKDMLQSSALQWVLDAAEGDADLAVGGWKPKDTASIDETTSAWNLILV